MKILYTENYEQMSRVAANLISAQVILKNDSVLGLATGSSPIGTYNQLIEWYNKGDISFCDVKTVNLDEYVGLTKDNDQSYAYFMKKNFLSHIDIEEENTNIPDGMNTDVAGECRRYDALIKSVHGIDLQLLGIGHNGHIGFNEPGEAFERETHCVALKESTIEANTRFFSSKDEVPKSAYTMGIKGIMGAKKIVLIASGEDKAQILFDMVTGPITPNVPASVLQLHNDVTIVADSKALSVIYEKAPELVTKHSKR